MTMSRVTLLYVILLVEPVRRAHDPEGVRFLCGGATPPTVCLSILRSECTLSLVSGASIPAEADDKVVIKSDRHEAQVTGPLELRGCVVIEAPRDALDYLSFFSSYRTVHLFRDQELEVHLVDKRIGCVGVCLDRVRWKKLRLAEPSAKAVGQNYEVTRYVFRPVPQPWRVSIFRVTDEVTPDGGVRRLKETQVETTGDDLMGLAFPMYL